MNREDYLNATGAEYICAMFENTGTDGQLILESEGMLICRLQWKREDLEKTLKDFEQLRHELIQLGKISIGKMDEQPLEEWNTEWLPPVEGSDPSAPLRRRARRYAKLISLQAPEIVLENEERCLAEELVLYYHRSPQAE